MRRRNVAAAMLLLGMMMGTTACAGQQTQETSASYAAESETAETSGETESTEEELTAEEETTAQSGQAEAENPAEHAQRVLEASNDTELAVNLTEETAQYPAEGKADVTLRFQNIEIQDTGYDALQAAVEESTQKVRDAEEETFTAGVEYAKEDPAMQSGDRPAYAVENTVQMKRADARVFSYTRTDYSDLGGAHPSTMVMGYHFDSQTGEELTLEAVASDYDGLYQYVLETLQTINETAGEEGTLFFEGYEDTVHSMFYGGEDAGYPVQWFMDQNGVVILFNNYDIASYATGRTVVEVPFSLGLIQSEYAL